MHIKKVSASEYQRMTREMPALALPATLGADYICVDAVRDSRLQPWFIAVDSGFERWMHGFHVSDIPGTPWRDASSPYGYGGPLSSSSELEFLNKCWELYSRFMIDHRIIAEYVRFHPLLMNDRFYGGQIEDNRDVVLWDLEQPDIASSYPTRLRSVIRKAERNSICYLERDLSGYTRKFMDFYNTAMQQMGADAFYLFSTEYFNALAATSIAKLSVCIKGEDSIEGNWLAAAVFLETDEIVEYHLAGSSPEGRSLGASSFLLDHAARAAQRRGRTFMYLGGGSDRSSENRLLFFKGAFSQKRLKYRTGSTVFNPVGRDEVKLAYPAEWSAHPERPIFHRKV